jgi:hypothetical protein
MFYDSCQHLRYLFFFLARSVLRRDVFYLICFLGGGKSAGHFRVQMREDGFLGDAVVIIIRRSCAQSLQFTLTTHSPNVFAGTNSMTFPKDLGDKIPVTPEK